MRSPLLCALLLLCCDPAAGTAPLDVGSSPWIERHQQAAPSDPVWKTGTPIIERDPADPAFMLATFLYRERPGDSGAPAIFGPFDWDRTYRMRKLAGSDVWHATLRLPSSYRGAYWLSWPQGRAANPQALTTMHIDGQPMQELFDDPVARHHAPHFDSISRTLGDYGWFEGPDAPPEPFLSGPSDVPHGRIETRRISSAALGNSRDVSIYTPPAYDPRRRQGYPLVLVFDRDEYLTTIGTPALLDRMIAAGAIPPVVALFVGTISDVDRNRELPGNATFQSFVHDELLPPIEREYAIARDPARRIVIGASYGGLSATLLAYRFPESFGGVIAQSGAYWWGPEHDHDGSDTARDYSEAARLFATGPKRPIRFALSVGALEGDIMVQPNRHLRDVLTAKGYAVDYREVAGSHDWVSWRSLLPDALIALLGKRPR